MAPETLLPGVYIEEISSGVRAIASATTSVAAFIGQAASGPLGKALAVGSFAELEQRLGQGQTQSPLGLAVAAFFDNGGRRALAVRVEDGSLASIEAGLEVVAGESWDLLCLPPARIATTDGVSGLGADVIATAARFCEEHRTFLILDADPAWTDKATALSGRAALGLDSRNAALYFPWLQRPGTNETLPPSGAVAGVFARTDVRRGVWKAPAGTEAGLRCGGNPSVTLSDQENGELNQAGVNCLRLFPGTGPVIWGARTISSDPEWRYVPVRRLSLFLERSIDEGTRWAVFEPNNEPLWATLRRIVEEFLLSLWRQGAFQGTKPEEAFFVRCDRTTTTAADIDQGLVNLLLGFAPLKPAEFTMLRITVRAGGRPTAPGRSRAALEDLALTAADLYRELPRERRQGGPALMTLFSGPSGTHKKSAAHALARRLERDLYRVDLSEMSRTYIGETEKNLARLFERAETHGAILLFDEADALFGKRTEVKDSHDRYANIEVSYLLTRLSEFNGLVILATSSAKLMDSAFLRRCRFLVDFD